MEFGSEIVKNLQSWPPYCLKPKQCMHLSGNNTLDDSIKREKALACFQKRIGKWSGARCTYEICH